MQFHRLTVSASFALLLYACSDESERDLVGGRGSEAQSPDGGSDASASEGGKGSDASGSAGNDRAPRSDSSVVSSPGGDSCASVRSSADRLPVHLAFAFDVSGSMGKGDEDWHDKKLKWDPIVAATRSFLEAPVAADQAATVTRASLTFFPAEDDKCEAGSYTEPSVPFTDLPSNKFAEAITAIEPKSADDWRGGTPTLFALSGTRMFIESYRREHPGKYAIVLLTDGYPQGCDDEEDEIATVVAESKTALAAGISTYVIGVANPKIDGAPDTVTNLGQIASAGGTERAYLLDTGDPAATSRAFNAAIMRIREAALSCNLAIPEAPDGRPFDKRRVVVKSSTQGASTTLTYDAACKAPNSWRYDDESAPKEIVLCPAACTAVEKQAGARIDVDFACDDVILI